MAPAKGSSGKGAKAPAKGGKATSAKRPTGPSPQQQARGGGGRSAPAVKAAAGRPAGASEPPRLRVRYNSELKQGLQRDLGLANPMLVPRIEKIVVNMGVGRAVAQPSLLEGAVRDLTLISGQ